jgi:hypothetical protein
VHHPPEKRRPKPDFSRAVYLKAILIFPCKKISPHRQNLQTDLGAASSVTSLSGVEQHSIRPSEIGKTNASNGFNGNHGDVGVVQKSIFSLN